MCVIVYHAVCRFSRLATANLFPSFAALSALGPAATIAQYRAWLQRTKAWKFADQLHLSQLSRVLRVWLTVVPANDGWAVTDMNICNVGADRRVWLGNDNVHYVWLSPVPGAAAAAAGGAARDADMVPPKRRRDAKKASRAK